MQLSKPKKLALAVAVATGMNLIGGVAALAHVTHCPKHAHKFKGNGWGHYKHHACKPHPGGGGSGGVSGPIDDVFDRLDQLAPDLPVDVPEVPDPFGIAGFIDAYVHQILEQLPDDVHVGQDTVVQALSNAAETASDALETAQGAMNFAIGTAQQGANDAIDNAQTAIESVPGTVDSTLVTVNQTVQSTQTTIDQAVSDLVDDAYSVDASVDLNVGAGPVNAAMDSDTHTGSGGSSAGATLTVNAPAGSASSSTEVSLTSLSR